jgi:hypothetical protein
LVYVHNGESEWSSFRYTTGLMAMQSSELAATYAALILADEGIEITVSHPPA